MRLISLELRLMISRSLFDHVKLYDIAKIRVYFIIILHCNKVIEHEVK
jgi:hypothetical protein